MPPLMFPSPPAKRRQERLSVGEPLCSHQQLFITSHPASLPRSFSPFNLSVSHLSLAPLLTQCLFCFSPLPPLFTPHPPFLFASELFVSSPLSLLLSLFLFFFVWHLYSSPPFLAHFSHSAHPVSVHLHFFHLSPRNFFFSSSTLFPVFPSSSSLFLYSSFLSPSLCSTSPSSPRLSHLSYFIIFSWSLWFFSPPPLPSLHLHLAFHVFPSSSSFPLLHPSLSFTSYLSCLLVCSLPVLGSQSNHNFLSPSFLLPFWPFLSPSSHLFSFSHSWGSFLHQRHCLFLPSSSAHSSSPFTSCFAPSTIFLPVWLSHLSLPFFLLLLLLHSLPSLQLFPSTTPSLLFCPLPHFPPFLSPVPVIFSSFTSFRHPSPTSRPPPRCPALFSSPLPASGSPAQCNQMISCCPLIPSLWPNPSWSFWQAARRRSVAFGW